MADHVPFPFKVFGLQRTGTNLMVALMQQNFHVYSLEHDGEWKHGPVREAARQWNGRPVHFVLCVKNPYAWAVSCFRYFRRAHLTDSTVAPQFRADPSMSFEQFLAGPHYSFPNPIARWNQMNQLWLATLPKDRSVLVRQEDQLLNQLRSLEAIERWWKLARRLPELQPAAERISFRARPAGPLDRDYYLNGMYLTEYSQDLLQRMNSLLDMPLMGQLKYPIERHSLSHCEINGTTIVVRSASEDRTRAQWLGQDPYRFSDLRDQGFEFTSFLDLGAGTGSLVAAVRALWPHCHVQAYESCPGRYRILRINSERFGRMDAHRAAIVPGEAADRARLDEICHDSSCAHSGEAMVSSVRLESVLSRLQSDGLVHVASRRLMIHVLRVLVAGGAIERIGHICGPLPAGTEASLLLADLASRYCVRTWQSDVGEILCATRRP
jgi:hypothetical protein